MRTEKQIKEELQELKDYSVKSEILRRKGILTSKEVHNLGIESKIEVLEWVLKD